MLATQLARSLRRDTGPRDPEQAGLTDQERRILELISGGMNNKAIARSLDISDGTVKAHAKHLWKTLPLLIKPSPGTNSISSFNGLCTAHPLPLGGIKTTTSHLGGTGPTADGHTRRRASKPAILP